MANERFDVTFIRGPRDVSPWKRAGRQIELLTGSTQNGEDSLRAQTAFEEKRQPKQNEMFPNAIYQERGRD
ncbi:MAG: hypothetical protein ACXVDB_05635 [Tumebacillaceae bacterium]